MTAADQKRARIRANYQALMASIDEYLRFLKINPDALDRKADEVLAIQRAVCEHYGYPLETMTTKNKRRGGARSVLARQVAMRIVRDLLRMTFEDVGEAFGKRHHGTAVFACESVANRLSTDARFKAEYHALRRRCESIVNNLDTPLLANLG